MLLTLTAVLSNRESYRFGVDPDVSTGLRKSTSMSALSSASTSPISMRRLKLGGFSVLPEPLSKQMARVCQNRVIRKLPRMSTAIMF